MKITDIKSRQVLDSRGNPTIETEVYTKKYMGRAIVPSGASTGIHEVLELRDNSLDYQGKSVHKAIANVNLISKHLKGIEVSDQKKIDSIMIDLDGTHNKSKLGANSILSISMAASRCAANENKIPLYEQLGNKKIMPVPFSNIINGGKHAGNKLAIQEFMIVPKNISDFKTAVMSVSETYHTLKELIGKKYGKISTSVGDEGGFAPPLNNAEEALNLLESAIDETGYNKAIKIAIDAAASEFYDGFYNLNKKLTSEELSDYYLDLIKSYPLISLEDPFDQDDFPAWQSFLKRTKIQIVGDDLLVTNKTRIKMALKKKLSNALLLKPNQIGTITESIDAAKLALKNKWNVMVSHRSGETEDPFIADLAVSLGCGQIKIGAPARGERTSKYNQLLRISDKIKKYGH